MALLAGGLIENVFIFIPLSVWFSAKYALQAKGEPASVPAGPVGRQGTGEK
jgi:hypothetical protein